MITAMLYRNDSGVTTDIALDQIHGILEGTDEVLWLDILDPTPDELRLVGQEFALHPLALEDISTQGQRPKVDSYADHLFLVFYGLVLDGVRLRTYEVHMFIGRTYLVTLHREPCSAIEAVARRWQAHTVENGYHGVSLLVYALLDAIVDEYFPIIDDIADRVDQLEDRIFDTADRGSQAEIFRIKKDLLAVRRIVGPQRDALNILLRRDGPLVDAETIVYFQAVYDNLLRTIDAIDTYRDLLASALEAYLNVTSNRLNQTMKTLTASSIILMSMTLVASIYGMNFERMPELDWSFGYPLAMGMMAAIGGVMYLIFKRIDWL